MAACSALALSSSSEAAETPLTYVGCGLKKDTTPSHLCRLDDGNEFGAFFQSATEVTYSVCVEFPNGKALCSNAQRAAPETLYVNRITSNLTGQYRVNWLVDGQQVGTWSFQVPVDPPIYRKTATVRPISGTVLVKEPGGGRFQPLDGTSTIRMGSVVDTTHGKVQLTTASSPSGGAQSGRFYGGLFRISQTGARSRFLGDRRALTMLKLVGELPSCGQRVRLQRAARGHRRGGRRLWGDAHGNFQAGGRYATVTVRGTKWLTEDTCGGTLVRVVRGVVSVKDLPHRRTVLLRAPGRLLVHPGGSGRSR